MSEHHEDTVPGAPHSSFKEYMTGFVLSVILTVIPFWLVMADVMDNVGLTIFYICALGVGQMLVHMIYFLHMNTKAEGGWIMLSLTFTFLLVVITIAGTLWVMYHLNANMMPNMLH